MKEAANLILELPRCLLIYLVTFRVFRSVVEGERKQVEKGGGGREEMKCEAAMAPDRNAELSSVVTETAFISGTT